MAEFILLMHGDSTEPVRAELWNAWFERLNALGVFDGGSAIGTGEAFRKAGVPGDMSAQIGGFIRVRAKDLTEARALLDGNPVYESGGTVEIRELPKG